MGRPRLAALLSAAALALVATVGLSSRVLAVCGDGVLEAAEGCDDGNTADCDGCSATCTIEGDGCGDGVVECYEACDDGNTVTGDGCSPNCLLEICGDGVFTPDTEECDDGNTVGGDGCSAGCACEPDVCGDGILGCQEECDDQNTVNGDGCDDHCRIEFPCSPLATPERECIVGVNRDAARVAAAQARTDAGCLKAAARGGQDLASCAAADSKGRVARASERLAARAARRCESLLPPIAFRGATTAAGAAAQAPLDALAGLFGGAPQVADRKLDRAGAACQRAVLQQHARLLKRVFAELNRLKEEALKGTRTLSQVCSNRELEDFLEAGLATSRKVQHARAKLDAKLAHRCAGVDVAALFDCDGAASVAELSACAAGEAVQAACGALAEGDGLILDCAMP
jgi:cysteine-rich repeat protein